VNALYTKAMAAARDAKQRGDGEGLSGVGGIITV
jgi:hypothetical protein